MSPREEFLHLGSFPAKWSCRAPSTGELEVVLWFYSDGYQGKEGAHDRGAK